MGFENHGKRVFDIAALADLDDAAYDALQPVRWPLPRGTSGETGRLFAQGGFPTADGRARIVAVSYRGLPSLAGKPFLLNTGRVRDQWHTMTRTGAVPSLMAHTPEPMLSIHPADAAQFGIEQDGLTRVSTADGQVVMRADLRHGQRRGEVYAPMHWTDRFASTGPVGRLVGPLLDPVSGQPELKATPVGLTPLESRFHGLLLRRARGALGIDHVGSAPRTGQAGDTLGRRARPTKAPGIEHDPIPVMAGEGTPSMTCGVGGGNTVDGGPAPAMTGLAADTPAEAALPARHPSIDRPGAAFPGNDNAPAS